jgi:hypothetical protein
VLKKSPLETNVSEKMISTFQKQQVGYEIPPSQVISVSRDGIA